MLCVTQLCVTHIVYHLKQDSSSYQRSNTSQQKRPPAQAEIKIYVKYMANQIASNSDDTYQRPQQRRWIKVFQKI